MIYKEVESYEKKQNSSLFKKSFKNSCFTQRKIKSSSFEINAGVLQLLISFLVFFYYIVVVIFRFYYFFFVFNMCYYSYTSFYYFTFFFLVFMVFYVRNIRVYVNKQYLFFKDFQQRR